MKPITLILVLPVLLFMYLVHVNRVAQDKVTFERQVELVKSILTPHSHAIHITKQITDDRNLTSIQFTQDGKQWGLDYLTPRELDSIKNIR